MRKPLLGIASLLIGTTPIFAVGPEPEILPLVEIRLTSEPGPAPIISRPTASATMSDKIEATAAKSTEAMPAKPSEPRIVKVTNDAAIPRVGACDTLPTPCDSCLPDPAAVTLQPCGCCQKQPRMWFDASYLLWWVKDGPLDSVIFTQGPTTANGAVGAPGVVSIFGGDGLDFGASNGGRLEGGYWLNNCHSLGVTAGVFLLERTGTGFAASTGINDTTALARSYFSPLNLPDPGGEQGSFVTFPPGQTGGAFAWASTRFWGTNTDLILNVRDRSCYRIDALVGFGYLDLQETLILGDAATFPAAPGASLAVIDSFATRNHFYSAEFGAKASASRGRLDLSGTFKIGLGATHQASEILGQSVATSQNGQVITSPGGFYAVESNSGTTTRDRFAVAPQGQAKLAYRFTEHLSGFVGYDFLYLSNVMRPGDQIDRVVNVNLVPVAQGFNPVPVARLTSPVRPLAESKHTDFFAHGISLGLGVTY